MNPVYDFNGQVALVTGASSGMGLATARAFAEAGAAVVLAAHGEDTLHAATEDLRSQGHEVLGIVCDVADEDQVAEMVDRAVATFGRLDMAFNNAGIQAPPVDAADETAEQFDRINGVNLRGVWASMKDELRHMRDHGSGAIVNCSSLGGLVGLPGRAAYHASKHGVIGLTRSAALEYAPRGIRINAICPGTFETPMVTDMIANGELDLEQAIAIQPIGRLGRADEIASVVLWQPRIQLRRRHRHPRGRWLHRPMTSPPRPTASRRAPTTPGVQRAQRAQRARPLAWAAALVMLIGLTAADRAPTTTPRREPARHPRNGIDRPPVVEHDRFDTDFDDPQHRRPGRCSGGHDDPIQPR